jgi:hypothetical protein
LKLNYQEKKLNLIIEDLGLKEKDIDYFIKLIDELIEKNIEKIKNFKFNEEQKKIILKLIIKKYIKFHKKNKKLFLNLFLSMFI